MGPLFLVFLTKCLLKCPSSTTSPPPPPVTLSALNNFWLRTCILFAKHSIWNVWQCSEYVSKLYSDFYAIYCIRHIQNSGYIQHSVFSGIYRHIQSYSVLLRNIHAYWDIIKVYSGLFRYTLAYSQTCHILSPSIFRTRDLFKTLWNVYQAYA